MGTVLKLSPSLAVRLKLLVEDLGGFHWEDKEQAEPILTDLCGPMTRERALLLMAIDARVPKAINRALSRSQGESIEACLRFVAKHFALREAIDRDEAQWTVETMAAAVGLIEVSPESVEAALAEAEAANEAVRAPRPAVRPVPPRHTSYQTSEPWFTASRPGDPPRRIMPFATGPVQTAPPAPTGPWMKSTTSATTINAPDYGLDEHPLGYGHESAIPSEVEDGKWCWSGFLGGGVWMWAHGIRWGLPVVVLVSIASRYLNQAWVGPLFNLGLLIFLGVKGNQLAWAHRAFASVAEFRSVQRSWVIVGSVLFIISLACLAIGAASLLVTMHIISMPQTPTYFHRG